MAAIDRRDFVRGAALAGAGLTLGCGGDARRAERAPATGAALTGLPP